MFSIHNFREPWELMPTALSLEIVIKEVGDSDTAKLKSITGLSEPQIERCKILLKFPKKYQDMSLDPNPKTRIPSNFWIEALPVLDLCREVLPDLWERWRRDGVTDRLVAKYRAKKIKSVIHFRRIMEAFGFARNDAEKAAVEERFRQYLENIDLETRAAFDEFVGDNRRIQGAIAACNDFISQLEKAKLDFVADKDELSSSLLAVRTYVDRVLERLKGDDPPPTNDGENIA
jgi:hypothetical protein